MPDLEELTIRLRDFAVERNWERFHTPKNLAMALSGEVGELIAELQWLTPEESMAVMNDPAAAARICAELGDVMIYLARLADVLGVDLLGVASTKVAQNERRYDVATYRDSARKAPPLETT